MGVLTVDLFQISAPPWTPAPLLFAAEVEDLQADIEAPRPPWTRSPAELPHSVSSPNRSHYPQLCCDQRYQAEDWTKAMTDGCFSAFCRRRTVLNSWMPDTDAKILAILRLSCCANGFTPCRMFILQKISESVFISTAINVNSKSLPYLHTCCQTKATTLLNVFMDLVQQHIYNSLTLHHTVKF